MTAPDEGVIKFRAEHSLRPLSDHLYAALVAELDGWRRIFIDTGLVGCDAGRYGGAGFGNLSRRVGQKSSGRGRRSMLITGSQTGHLPHIGLDSVCVVERYDVVANTVVSHGPVLPSSESMTHGAIYDLTPTIGSVIHCHSPAIWRAAARLRIPTTAEGVAYGTPEMAEEVARLARSTALVERGLLVMSGHEDGVVAFGRDPAAAGAVMVTALARALETTPR